MALAARDWLFADGADGSTPDGLTDWGDAGSGPDGAALPENSSAVDGDGA